MPTLKENHTPDSTHFCCEEILAGYKDSDDIKCCACSKHPCKKGWKGYINHPDEEEKPWWYNKWQESTTKNFADWLIKEATHLERERILAYLKSIKYEKKEYSIFESAWNVLIKRIEKEI